MLAKNPKSIFISDCHLGSRHAKDELLANFLYDLKDYYVENIFIVGDFIDGWKFRRGSQKWSDASTKCFLRLLMLAEQGTNILICPGNHDEFLDKFVDNKIHNLGNIYLADYFTYSTKDGLFKISHGDDFDCVIRATNNRYMKFVCHIGDMFYEWLITANKWLNKAQKLFGCKQYSLSKYVKNNFKDAVKFISSFETLIAEDAKHNGYSGAICGHIHNADMKKIDGIQYINCGDWVENCTYIVHYTDNTWEVRDY